MQTDFESTAIHKNLSIVPIRRALVSVSDKDGLIEFCQKLHDHGVEIISTGGTGLALSASSIPFTKVENITKKAEAFGGRMKTLSFEIFSSLLFRRENEGDQKIASALEILPIDLLVCSFYPFSKCLIKYNNNEVDYNELIENIDIGGPAMVRSAAKNYQSVTVLTASYQYRELLDQMEIHGGSTLSFRERACKLAFAQTAKYDSVISEFLSKDLALDEKNLAHFSPLSSSKLRYGENAHQEASVIVLAENSLASCIPLQGKELSFNNLLDSDAALKTTLELKTIGQQNQSTKFRSAVVIVKHNNPCGIALAADPMEALLLAWKCDEVSAFGSIIAFSETVPEVCAQWLSDKFVEVILAPAFSKEALAIFSKKKNLRLLALPEIFRSGLPAATLEYRSVHGGLLVQDVDEFKMEEWISPTEILFSDCDDDLLQVGVIGSKFQKSNAIAIAFKNSNGIYIPGSCGGQPNRLDSIKLAVERAKKCGIDLDQALLVSDAFFPFKDNIELLAELKIKKVAAPSGSIKDSEVVLACDKHKISMAFLKHRHFKH